MKSIDALVRDARHAAGISQRALAQRAGTSQPAVARYERGAVAPSLETLQRLMTACGQRLRLVVEPIPDPHQVELAVHMLDLTPEQRLQALQRYNRLHDLASHE